MILKFESVFDLNLLRQRWSGFEGLTLSGFEVLGLRPPLPRIMFYIPSFNTTSMITAAKHYGWVLIHSCHVIMINTLLPLDAPQQLFMQTTKN